MDDEREFEDDEDFFEKPVERKPERSFVKKTFEEKPRYFSEGEKPTFRMQKPADSFEARAEPKPADSFEARAETKPAEEPKKPVLQTEWEKKEKVSEEKEPEPAVKKQPFKEEMDEVEDEFKVSGAGLWKVITSILAILLIVSLFTHGFRFGGTEAAPTGAAAGLEKEIPSLPEETPETAPARVDVSADNDPVKGNANATVTIIEFSDFQCPFSGRAQETINQILKDYNKDVKLVFRDFPLGFHENAEKAAEAAQCAHEQGKFWEYHDKLFGNQDNLDVASLKKYADELGLNTATFNKCLDSGKYEDEIKKDIEDGKKAGVKGTPTFFINGRIITGAQPLSAFKTIIEEELK